MDELKLPEKPVVVGLNNFPELPYSVDEAMNGLKNNVEFLGHQYKKIMVVSSLPDEGKSFVSAMLWRKLYESGRKCVYVDADLRKSVTVDKYEIKREDGKRISGLSNYLSDNCGIDDAYFNAGDENAFIVPNADNAPRPALLLENGRMEQLLDTLAIDCDRVIVDVPPLELLSDGEVVGRFCDGALLVVRCGVTDKRSVRRSIRKLDRIGCPFLGFVLSRAETKRSGYYGRKYGGYYGGKYGGYYYGGGRRR